MRRILLAIGLMAFAASALAEETIVRWNAIVGRQGHEADSPYMTVGPLTPSANWVWVESGSVTLNLATGRVKIEARHISVANNSPGFATPVGSVLGGAGFLRAGKFVCDALGKAGGPELVQTEPFELDDSGSVTFRGFIIVPQSCRDAPDQIAFVMGGGNPGNNTYFAFGAGRVVLNDAD